MLLRSRRQAHKSPIHLDQPRVDPQLRSRQLQQLVQLQALDRIHPGPLRWLQLQAYLAGQRFPFQLTLLMTNLAQYEPRPMVGSIGRSLGRIEILGK